MKLNICSQCLYGDILMQKVFPDNYPGILNAVLSYFLLTELPFKKSATFFNLNKRLYLRLYFDLKNASL